MWPEEELAYKHGPSPIAQDRHVAGLISCYVYQCAPSNDQFQSREWMKHGQLLQFQFGSYNSECLLVVLLVFFLMLLDYPFYIAVMHIEIRYSLFFFILLKGRLFWFLNRHFLAVLFHTIFVVNASHSQSWIVSAFSWRTISVWCPWDDFQTSIFLACMSAVHSLGWYLLFPPSIGVVLMATVMLIGAWFWITSMVCWCDLVAVNQELDLYSRCGLMVPWNRIFPLASQFFMSVFSWLSFLLKQGWS